MEFLLHCRGVRGTRPCSLETGCVAAVSPQEVDLRVFSETVSAGEFKTQNWAEGGEPRGSHVIALDQFHREL